MGYGTKLLCSALAILLLVGATNFAVDPYGIFNSRVDGTAQNSYLFDTNVRMTKAHVVSRFAPEAVALGSSRTEVGISPSDPRWEYDRVYNLGLPQATIQEIFEYLQHAIAAGSLEQAVYGVDFFQFNPELEPPPDFQRCRLRDPGAEWTGIRASLCDLPALFFSRTAFFASVTQWRADFHDIVYLHDGSRSDTAKEDEIKRAGSQHAAFLMTEYRYLQESDLLQGLASTDVRVRESTGHYFEALLHLSHRNNIDLRLFISPIHARQLELMDDLGLWNDFVRLKRYLLVTTHEVAKQYNAEPYPVWDFADYSVYTTERLPPLDDSDSRMQWYWESSHYTLALGGRILAHIFAGEPTGLGKKLDIDTFDTWIAHIETRRAAYRRAAQDQLRLMRDYLSSAEIRDAVLAEAG